MREAHDHSTLKWIRGELDELIGQARRALEEFVEGPGDAQRLDDCIGQLHQVRGTLQLMQLYGAAMLAEEMELVASALRDGVLRRQDDAAEALMLGLVHLPDYLEKLEGGSRDIPLLILPMLNELRATRDAALLSEVAVFVPDLEQRLASGAGDSEGNPGLPDLIRRLRLNYHKGLLNWFRDRDVEAGLSGIGEVLEEMERQAGTESVKRLFRAGRAISEGLREGSVKTGIATKELFGALDRELKRIIDVGEAVVAESPSNELLKNFLYYIASASSENPLINSVRKEFGLDSGLLNQAEIDQQRADLQTLSSDLLESLRAAIGTDLTTIKDGLDLFIRGQSSDMERMLALEEPMRKVADTLGMIGQGGLRERLKRQADQVAKHRESGQAPDEQNLMAMAGDILFIEKSLENLATLGHPRLAPAEQDSGLQDLPQGEFEKLVDSVMHEAQVDLSRNKESIINFIEEPENKGHLENVPARFRSIAGALKIMNLGQVAQLLEGVSDYVESDLLGADTIPPSDRLNLFADAITAIEYFMEAVTEGRGVQTEILEIAKQSLNELGVPSGFAPSVSMVAKDVIDEAGSKPAELSVSHQAEKIKEERGSETDFETEAEAGTPAEVEMQPVVEKPVLDEVEPEILEIFIEEAKEEVGVIQEYLPRWLRNQDDQDALSTFRRSFHTLKGSGRLVGAVTIGELAWSIENLLNRVIDETVEVSPDIFAVLSETQEVLPGLIECQESGRPPEVEVQPIMDRAFALASSDSVAPSPAPAVVGKESGAIAGEQGVGQQEMGAEGPQSLADVVPFPDLGSSLSSESDQSTESDLAGSMGELDPSVAPIRVEPTLLEIFASETRGHIDNLHRFVELCGRDPQVFDLGKSDIPRTLHTLHGSADMAGVKPIAEISSALETYTNDLKGEKQESGEEVLELIHRSAVFFETVLDSINVPTAELPNWQGLLQDIEKQRNLGRLETEAAVTEEVTVAANQEGGIDEAPEEPIEQPEGAVFGQESSIESATGQVDQGPPEAATSEECEQTPEDQASDAAVPISGIEFFELDGDPELTEIFLEEARELHDSVESSLQTWQQNGEDSEAVSDLQRTLHTLKGGARLAGAMPVGDLSHAFESLLTALGNGRLESTPKVFDLAQAVSDRLAEQIDDIGKGPRLRRSDDLIQSLEGILSTDVPERRVDEPVAAGKKKKKAEVEQKPSVSKRAEVVAESGPSAKATEKTAGEEREQLQTGSLATAAVSFGVEEMKPAQPPARTQREHIRVRSDLLDRLVNNAGEVSIYRARLEQQNGALEFNLSELEQTVDRLRSQLRKLEIETEAQILFRYEKDKDEGQEPEESFDPLELDRFSTMQHLSRSLMETVNDLTNINDYLDDLNKETETLLLQQARVSTDLQDGLLRTRMVPFSQLVPRLHRVVRQTANSLGREAKFEVYGAEGELDRGILDRMIGPLEHILRNAVSHGIEPVEARREAGKDVSGHIAMYLAREGNDVILTVTDDGGGIKIDSIRRRAIEKGLLDAHAEVPDSDILPFVLEHGFSTKDEVTQISGRGVGLDVVVKEVKQLGGSLDITSKPGEGTSFIIRLPLTLAISDALLVELGEEVYAIPHTSIEGVVRVAREDLVECYEGREPFFSYSDNDYLVRYLGGLLNVGQLNLSSEQRKWYPLLLVRAGEHRVALQVDGLLGNRQIVVKSVGPQVSTIRWISGGTILGDGRVALIVDVTALVRMDAAHTIPVRADTEQAVQPGLGRTVMVVDDSITVRKVTGRVLERHGMHVVTAKDGVDAVAQLQESHPDLMLLDIEMPRMDGYELARHMRNTEDLRAIPIIMITSRSGEKHRNLAMELGVKRYLGKPYQEAELLDNIYSVLDEVGQ